MQEERDKADEAGQNKNMQIRNEEQRMRDEAKKLEEKVEEC